MKQILIKIPTRDRKIQFFNILDQYLSLLDESYKNVTFLLTLDSDDESMNDGDIEKRIKFLYNLYDVPITRYYGESKNKIDAVNRDMDTYLGKWDILMLTSDDMVPVKYGYNKTISDDMEANFPDLDGILYYPDGFTPLNTLPIIGKKYYERFNYIYNPVYESFFCDNEFHEVADMLCKQKKIANVIIKHMHPCNSATVANDVLYSKNQEPWDRDQEIYLKRKLINFDLKVIPNGK